MMKKTVISSVLLVLLLIGIFFYINTDRKKYSELHTFNSDKVCKYSNVEDVDGDNNTSINNAYVYIDKLNVSKIVFQSLLEKNNMTNSVEMQNEILKIFDNIKGINYEVYETKNNYVVEVTYNYNDINIKELRSELNTLLDDTSIFLNVDKLPVTYDKLLEYDLKDYECK